MNLQTEEQQLKTIKINLKAIYFSIKGHIKYSTLLTSRSLLCNKFPSQTFDQVSKFTSENLAMNRDFIGAWYLCVSESETSSCHSFLNIDKIRNNR